MSRIEWTDATWNPIRGCTRVSRGCERCYAERMAARFSKFGEPFYGFTGNLGRWSGLVRLIPEKLDEPLHWRKPRRVFVNSMSDLFHEGWLGWDRAGIFRGPGFSQLCDVASVMRYCERHTFQVLTKRANVMADIWSRVLLKLNAGGPLPNVWLGVSVEDQKTADERIPLLLQTPAAKRFVSYEPALEEMDISQALRGYPEQTAIREYVSREMALDAGEPAMEGSLYRDEEWQQTMPALDWVIIGGESGPGARPCDIQWIRSIVRQCRGAGVACFVKQLGANPVADENTSYIDWLTMRVRHPKGGDTAEWPEDLRVREFPG